MLKSTLLAVLMFGTAATSNAPPAPPPLCRVQASATPSPVPWLTSITVTLRPRCPLNGSAQVRLLSDLGSTDPPVGWLTLTPCRRADEQACTVTWRGVLLRPLNWHPQWEATSGRPYDIPLRP